MAEILRLCTSNAAKVREFSEMLGRRIEAIELVLDEPQGLDPIPIAAQKASQAFELCRAPVMVDDSGLGLAALGGFPGALVTWVLTNGGVELLHRMLPAGAEETAVATTVIGYADYTGVRTFPGSLRGRIVPHARGEHGFGFDPVFIPEGHDITLAEMTWEAKNALSPRRRALEAMLDYLEHPIRVSD